MSIPNTKDLKKIIKMCREMGIKHYKGDGYEFILTDEAPLKASKSKPGVLPTSQGSNTPAVDPNFETDDLTPEQLLMWSVTAGTAGASPVDEV